MTKVFSSLHTATLIASGTVLGGALLFAGCSGGGNGNGPSPSPTGTPTLTSTPAPPARPLAFISTRDGNAEVYRASADGSNAERLTNTNTNEDNPELSRDGQIIVFDAQVVAGNDEIFRRNLVFNQTQQITNDGDQAGPDDTQPTISPNGSTIAWTSGRGGAPNIYLADITGTNQRPLGGTLGFDPSFSPDGTRIVYVRQRANDTEKPALVVRTLNSDAEAIIEITAEVGLASPRFSPDGSRIVFTTVGRDSSQIQIVQANGSDAATPTPGPSAGLSSRNATFTPDGTELVFEASGGTVTGTQLFAAPLSNVANVRALTTQGDNSAPSFAH